MKVAIIIHHISVIVWLLPPCRQYKGEYFYFFLTLALLDPAASILAAVFQVFAYRTYLIGVFILILSLFDLNIIRRNLLIIAISLSILIALFIKPFLEINHIILIELMIVVYILLKRAIKDYDLTQRANIPFIMLFSYAVSLAAKYLFLLFSNPNSYLFFYLTTIFEILMAVYFTIFKVTGMENGSEEFKPEGKNNLF